MSSSDSSKPSSEKPSPSGPGRINHFPIKLTMKCKDKPGESRGVIVLQVGDDQARLVLKVLNPQTYEQFFVGREYEVVIRDKPRSELDTAAVS